ncbi:hypothetical protein EWP20_12000 [Neisseria meningitidis]|nr:hypothetical protein [Neisseria meningitidis]MBG8643525.1 hypothetical protein [Neisseria meningitidis]MBG8766687.1 hypothetical protein [Neisseria meningitidis]MBG8786960.1 hypothetical protein [Neisseria meningitidis]MBJ7802864.1 hypothetical protein [Neisseria meningitidis]
MGRKQPKTCVWVSAVGRERNFAKVSNKNRNLKSRHSLKTENRNQKPKIPSFPRRRESRFVGTETYRVKRFL